MGDPKLADGIQSTAQKTEPEKVSCSAPQNEPKYESQPETGKSQFVPQSEETENQPGFFEGISNFFKERKELAEEEERFVGESALTNYIGETLLGVMNELRQDLRGGSPRDYFVLHVYKGYCDLVFWKYNEAELKYENSKLIVRIEYKTYQNIFQFKDGYTEIKSRKAKKWFRQVVFHEHIKIAVFFLWMITTESLFYIVSSNF